MTGMKMITCCYCGAQDVMRMGKGKRVTLSCLSCGAPMRKISTVRADKATPQDQPVPERINQHKKPQHLDAYKKKKKRKGSGGWLAGLAGIAILSDADDWFDFDMDLDDFLDFD